MGVMGIVFIMILDKDTEIMLLLKYGTKENIAKLWSMEPEYDNLYTAKERDIILQYSYDLTFVTTNGATSLR